MKNFFKVITAKSKGFTIIELSVVIVVIGVLASIVIVSGGSYLKKSSESNAKTSLVAARATLKQEYDKNGEYPEDAPSDISIPDGFSYDTNGSDFRICGNIAGSAWYISSAVSEPTQGACPSLVEASSFMASFSGTSDLRLASSDPEYDYLVTYPVQVEGGESPYAYSLAEGEGNSSVGIDGIAEWNGVDSILVITTADNLDSGFSSSWLAVVYLDPSLGSQIVFIVIPPEDPTLEMGNNLILGAADQTFSSMCSSAPEDFSVNLKLVVTDSASNQAEVPFTVSCP